ncbi:FUSC family protein [Cellvibrio zantedeschiae]|uniref:FUSC family protein n=1 Tax=Cellvibrio zantedeschiae TaxID=1237077 RepID=A0ABQ3AR25_9GAMM|nr:FUSC family protein [Cellvibrio zantedeschiae]GGY63275.1 FUSC family protein [Cellvibrio zantedeschiae]
MQQKIKSLFILNKPSRPWHVALVATIGMTIPALLGVYFEQMANAILACVGTMVILYIPRTSIPHRMVTLAVCSFGIVACFTLGLGAGFNISIAAIMLVATTMLVDFICRYYAIPAPGNFFFVFLAALGCTLPFNLELIPARVGLVALGCMLSCLIAFFYSLCVNLPAPNPVAATEKNIARLFLQSAVIGFFVGGSYLLAEIIGLQKPYWVPISCAAIMQGANFTLVWQRNIHRVAGTVLGMGLAWCIFSQSLQGWSFALAIILLFFIVELLVVHHYGLAVIFITPLTLLLAEGSASRTLHESLVVTRLGDIALGSAIGFVGGWVMHHPKILLAPESLLNKYFKAKDQH